MNRFFGAKKEVAPPPSLEDATQKMGGRIEALDAKIRSLDQQLLEYQHQLTATRVRIPEE
jgi:charged multivesicular body protein 5